MGVNFHPYGQSLALGVMITKNKYKTAEAHPSEGLYQQDATLRQN
jgi:hypothetical protein